MNTVLFPLAYTSVCSITFNRYPQVNNTTGANAGFVTQMCNIASSDVTGFTLADMSWLGTNGLNYIAIGY